MASPITLNMRPSVSTPTGTLIGDPVATTTSPRRKPSVESIAMQRTVLSPVSCWTSMTTLRPSWVVTTSASIRFGSLPGGNSTSTTAPMTWLILPVTPGAAPTSTACSVACAIGLLLLAQGLRPTDDVHELRRDRGLTHLVGGQRERFDHVACRLRGVLHGNHPRRVLAGLVLQHGLVHEGFDIPWQERIENHLRVRLVDVVSYRPARLDLRHADRQQGLHDRILAQGRHPASVGQEQGVGPALVVLLEGSAHRRQDRAHARAVLDPTHVGHDVAPVAGQEVATLAADRHIACLTTVVLVDVSVDRTQRVRVQGPGEAAVGGHHDQERPIALSPLQIWVAVLGGSFGRRREDLHHLLGV